ncbi:NAD-dependent epimerase/dehydratase family protein [Oceanobacillus jeddahense]|uniref:NAD-dependent epimerase/dehydratase family protein n=1 Tax=Oceanobacillus jeddahense TaxID=1462527 RepID=A0ABY5JY83_9BACI|nr:NAD-dependent epimerase/dehydratase family protein [Oceanobacillus jeddahense]UUI03504.1 NAD-dependent epimerase/dehydratase family protein [Oceanobacillus jeddahense]
MKNVFILGGTGLLGYHTVRELLKREYIVSTVALPPMPAPELLPPEVECHLGDINEMTDEQILDMLAGKDMFIYAAGADERMVPEIPATHFFYEANVLPTQRLAHLARKAGIKKFVIYGSYFAHFAEKWPELELKKQAYPRTRLLQEEVAFMEGEGQMDVMSLRLPYIFGTMPGRTPLWAMFFPQIEGKEIVPVLGGGSAMVTVQQVAEATIGALEYGEHGEKYTISDTNMKHKDFFQIIANELGQKDTVIQVVPLGQMKPAMAQYDEQTAAAGKEHGIHQVVAAEIQNRDAYINPDDTMPLLKYNKADIHQAIAETMKRCIEDTRK